MDEKEMLFLDIIKDHSININKDWFLLQNYYCIVNKEEKTLIGYQPLCLQAHVHKRVWIKFEDEFDMDDSEIIRFMKIMLLKHLNINGNTIHKMFLES